MNQLYVQYALGLARLEASEETAIAIEINLVALNIGTQPLTNIPLGVGATYLRVVKLGSGDSPIV